MNSRQARKAAGGLVIGALAVCVGVVYRPPTPSAADDGVAADVAEMLDELAALGLDPNTPASSSSTGAATAAPKPWPADPFHRQAPTTPSPANTITNAPSETPARDYMLSAILGGPNPLAMIDGQFVGVGDTLTGDVTVTAIDELTVTLRDTHGTRVLKLPQ